MDPACFHICGVSQAHVDHAKQVIKDLIVKEQDFNLINDKALFSLSELELQNIYDMQTAMDVSISFHKSSQEEAKLTIEGLSKDVLKASNEIHEMLKKVRPEETFKDVPQHWDDMPANTPCLSFPIQPQTQEHIDVLKQFEDTCKKNVLKVSLLLFSIVVTCIFIYCTTILYKSLEIMAGSGEWNDLYILKNGLKKYNSLFNLIELDSRFKHHSLATLY